MGTITATTTTTFGQVHSVHSIPLQLPINEVKYIFVVNKNIKKLKPFSMFTNNRIGVMLFSVQSLCYLRWKLILNVNTYLLVLIWLYFIRYADHIMLNSGRIEQFTVYTVRCSFVRSFVRWFSIRSVSFSFSFLTSSFSDRFSFPFCTVSSLKVIMELIC